MDASHTIINVRDMIPHDWSHAFSQEKLKVWYEFQGRGNRPKAFYFPENLIVDQNYVAGAAMYLGDGKLSKDLHHLDFTSIDKDMIKYMLSFFRKFFKLKNSDFSFYLYHNECYEVDNVDWAVYLDLPLARIKTYSTSRHRKEAFNFQIGGKVMRVMFERILNRVLRSAKLSTNKHLRRAFLKGIFAAEGGIGIHRKQNYIAYMGFHLSNKKEEELGKLIHVLLEKENIASLTLIRKESDERIIQITNWQHYWRMYKIGIFDLNERKKKKFLNKAKKTKVNFELTHSMINHLIDSAGISHRQLAFKLQICPATLSHLKQKKTTFINLPELVKLAEMNDLPLEEIQKDIKATRINRSTIIEDKDFLPFIFSLQKA